MSKNIGPFANKPNNFQISKEHAETFSEKDDIVSYDDTLGKLKGDSFGVGPATFNRADSPTTTRSTRSSSDGSGSSYADATTLILRNELSSKGNPRTSTHS